MKTLRDATLRALPIIGPETFLDEAIQELKEEPLRAVALVNEQQYMGMFTEEDLLPGLIPQDGDYSTLAVGPYIHPTRVVAEMDSPVEAILSAALRKGQNLIPVLNNRIFCGVVTVADLQNL
ncbi:MAG: CBS domain-containing protein [bacterium]|jgi:CBS domain-containing protein